MEIAFGEEAYAKHFDHFMRYYLTVKTGELPNIKAVYEVFKEYFLNRLSPAEPEELVADLHRFARHYCAMELDQEAKPALRAAFADLRELRANVAYPLLLQLYDDYDTGTLSAAELEESVRYIESYVFRRAVCDIPTNSMNRTFESFARDIDQQDYLASLKAAFLGMPYYRRFPDDQEFKSAFVRRDLYNFPRRLYWLRRFENHGRKERVHVADYTTEHIMPQNEDLSAEWQAALGSEWRRVHDTWLHTSGNLTLTGYNAEYGDKPFAAKRDMAGGFRESPLHLNEGLGDLANWDEEQIKRRANRLALAASAVWPRPSVTLPVQTGDGAGSGKSKYSIANHKFIADGGAMQELFERLRRQLKALNPAITEEFLKLYVSYKIEMSLVDVQPQSAQLRLWVNMPFDELYDPEGIARDVTDLGHHGIGNVELSLSADSQIPAVIEIVKQALERQVGEPAQE